MARGDELWKGGNGIICAVLSSLQEREMEGEKASWSDEYKFYELVIFSSIVLIKLVTFCFGDLLLSKT